MAKKIKEYNRLAADQLEATPPLNDLTGRDWVQLSKSVNSWGGPIASKRKEHGAAFPPSLAAHFIQLYTAADELVLDPFLGVGTVADACTLTGRHCVGFELNEAFFNHARGGLDPVDGQALDGHQDRHELWNESCSNIRKRVKDGTVALTITSPPYADLLHKVAEHFANYRYEKNIYRGQGKQLAMPYSANDEDFGNLDFRTYLARVQELMAQLLKVARPGSYNVWVVRDFRDMEHHVPYIDLHSRIAEVGKRAGWILWDIVIWDQTQQRKLVKLGGPKQRRMYFNIGHSYCVIFRKNIPGEKFRAVEHDW